MSRLLRKFLAHFPVLEKGARILNHKQQLQRYKRLQKHSLPLQFDIEFSENHFPAMRYFSSANDFDEFMTSEFMLKRNLLLSDLSSRVQNSHSKKYIDGYCSICNQIVPFAIDMQYRDKGQVNFRERLECMQCHLNNRQRFVFSFLLSHASSDCKIYVQEQTTEFFALLAGRFGQITGSEFLGENIPSGSIIDDIRHENCLCYSFDDNSFDILLSNDVFEHVSDVHAAFSEAYRILTDNGSLIFTVPYCWGTEKTIQRTFIKEGHLTHVKPPVYHGNPISADGSLVFYDYGKDLLKFVLDAGFRKIEIVSSTDCFYGHLSPPILFWATK